MKGLNKYDGPGMKPAKLYGAYFQSPRRSLRLPSDLHISVCKNPAQDQKAPKYLWGKLDTLLKDLGTLGRHRRTTLTCLGL